MRLQRYLSLFYMLMLGVFCVGCASNLNQQNIDRSDLDTLYDFSQNSIDISQQQTDIMRILSEQNRSISEDVDALDAKLTDLYKQLAKESLVTEILSDDAEEVDTTHTSECAPSNSKMILGRYEWLWLSAADYAVSAQLDTGLEYSRIYTSRVTRFERDEKKWLRFIISSRRNNRTLELPIIRSEKITFAGESDSVRASVVEMSISLASFSDNLEFLVIGQNERKKTDKPGNGAAKKRYSKVVLGKNFLTDVALVDVALKYTQEKPEKK